MRHETTIRAPARSFIVRVWKDEEDGQQLRGEVEYIGTGEKRLFLNSWSLLTLLESWQRDLERVV